MHSKIRCIIVEDEVSAAVVLEMHISRIPILHLQGRFNTVAALAAIDLNNVDLIFLDINLPGISGMDFAKTFDSSNKVIFTTAYSEFAADAYETEAVDYLLKPVSFEKFSRAVNRHLKQHGQDMISAAAHEADRAFVFIKCDRQLVKIYTDEILYLESQRNRLLIYLDHGATLKTHLSISDILERLPENKFLRIHRSYVVAAQKVERLTQGFVVIGKSTIPIGRFYRASKDVLVQASFGSLKT